MRDLQTERVLNALCFECASAPDIDYLPFGRHGFQKANCGGKVDFKSTCIECPIAVLRGDHAPISAGKPHPVFTKQMMPGGECESRLDSYDTWLPCFECDRAEKNIEDGAEVYTLRDLDYCCKFCIAKGIRDAILESEAEARMS